MHKPWMDCNKHVFLIVLTIYRSRTFMARQHVQALATVPIPHPSSPINGGSHQVVGRADEGHAHNPVIWSGAI